jgi:hypothetical protein
MLPTDGMSKGSDQRGPDALGALRLEPGSHRSPNDGVCVVELASMIAGEPFSDRPGCVCRVLGSFLRSWNDRAGYADRQRLYPYASRVVGTGGYRRISRIRRDICLSYAGADLEHGPLRRALARLRMRGRIAWAVGLGSALRLKSGAGAYAARVCFARGGSDQAFALLDRLLDVGSSPTAQHAPTLPSGWVPGSLEELEPSNGNGNGSANGNGHRDADLGVRATILARERAKTRAARESGSGPAAAGDRPRGRRARPPAARS